MRPSIAQLLTVYSHGLQKFREKSRSPRSRPVEHDGVYMRRFLRAKTLNVLAAMSRIKVAAGFKVPGGPVNGPWIQQCSIEPESICNDFLTVAGRYGTRNVRFCQKLGEPFCTTIRVAQIWAEINCKDIRPSQSISTSFVVEERSRRKVAWPVKLSRSLLPQRTRSWVPKRYRSLPATKSGGRRLLSGWPRQNLLCTIIRQIKEALPSS
jgi:hypothetical protein